VLIIWRRIIYLNLYWSSNKLNWTGLPALPGPVFSSNQHSILQCFMFVYFVTAFELWGLEIFWKINLDQSVGIRNNNLDRKGLWQVVIIGKGIITIHTDIKLCKWKYELISMPSYRGDRTICWPSVSILLHSCWTLESGSPWHTVLLMQDAC
jgi:hypothetical protein